MPVSQIQQAKRALVSLLKKLATFYAVILCVDRDSPDKAILAKFLVHKKICKEIIKKKGAAARS